jgi:hypothetical protein
MDCQSPLSRLLKSEESEEVRILNDCIAALLASHDPTTGLKLKDANTNTINTTLNSELGYHLELAFRAAIPTAIYLYMDKWHHGDFLDTIVPNHLLQFSELRNNPTLVALLKSFVSDVLRKTKKNDSKYSKHLTQSILNICKNFITLLSGQPKCILKASIPFTGINEIDSKISFHLFGISS